MTNKELLAKIDALEADLRASKASKAQTGQTRITVGEKGAISYGGFGRRMSNCLYAGYWVRFFTEILGEDWQNALGGTEKGGELRTAIRHGIGDGTTDEKGHHVGDATHRAAMVEGGKRAATYRAREAS